MSKICPSCQEIFDDSLSFCSHCGSRLIVKATKKICPNCQEIFDANHSFCSHCGSRLIDNVDVIPNRPLTKEQVSALYDIIVSTSDPDRMTKLQEVAESGNIYAMNSVGLCFNYGHGVKKNLKEAVKWYQKAADAGNADAMLNLGCCYEKGEGVKKNLKEAMKLYEKAAEQGIARAMTNIGNLCTVEGQKKKDYTEYKKAVKWFQKAIDAGDPYGMSGLGWCYEYGCGVKKTLSEAFRWYAKSLENGREKDEWITKRMKVCDPDELKACITNIYVEDYNSSYRHLVETKRGSLNFAGDVYISYTMEVENVGNRTVKIVCNLTPDDLTPDINSYPSLSDNNKLLFDEDGTRYNDFGCFDGKTISGSCHFSIFDFGLKKSGKYYYDGKLSAYDEENDLLSTCEFSFFIDYKHKMFGTDDYSYDAL